MFKAAVTGTNGKTSTIFLASQLIDAAGYECTTLGTLGLISRSYSDSDPVLVGQNAMANLAFELEHLYATEAFIFEAYSSCIESRFYDSMDIDLAAITNISIDHLDHHGSKHKYRKAKLRLFREILPSEKFAVFCSDGILGQEILHICKERNIKSFSYGLNKKAHLCLIHIEDCLEKSRVHFRFRDQEYAVNLSFGGEIFIYNWMCAMSIAILYGVGIQSLLDVCEDLTLPPGRLEKIGTKKGAPIYIDYAHNANALNEVLRILRTRTQGELHVVFGCGGNREKSRRSSMGNTAFDMADKIYITDDNIRFEDANQIRLDILKHCPTGIPYVSRNLAIEAAMKALEPKDVLLIAGKGHEAYQEIKGKKIKSSDRNIVLTNLANLH